MTGADPAPQAGVGWPAPAIDLSRPRTVHVIGIGGAGMSAIATVLAAMGHTVSGSDLRESVNLRRLRAEGIACHVGHAATNLSAGVEVVTRSTAIGDSNPEVAGARDRSLPVLSRAEVLAAICGERRSIAVAGTHGKTTTSSMLALALRSAGLAPSFIIGGDVNEIGTGAVWDQGEHFVVEADESDGTFLVLPREAAIVTNVEPDHLEHYGGWPQLRDAFDRFVLETPGPVVVCADDDGARALAERVATASHPSDRVFTYGLAADATYRMDRLERLASGTSFDLCRDGEVVASVSLPVPGAHNARNAAAALTMAICCGADPARAAAAFTHFGGVARRFEFRGEAAGVTFVDDYAHLPTEVEAALSAAADGEWRRVVAVFQPHRYSRTAAFGADFADSFTDADVLVVTDVYSAGETPRPGVSGKLIVNAVLDHHPWSRVVWLPHRSDVTTFLRSELRPGDLCLTLGAGDLTTLPDEMLTVLVPVA